MTSQAPSRYNWCFMYLISLDIHPEFPILDQSSWPVCKPDIIPIDFGHHYQGWPNFPLGLLRLTQTDRTSLTLTLGKLWTSVFALPSSDTYLWHPIDSRFSLKFQRIVRDEAGDNFISKLHRGKLAIIPWPVIQSSRFYDLFGSLKSRLDKQPCTHKSAGEFLLVLKMLMAKLKVRNEPRDGSYSCIANEFPGMWLGSVRSYVRPFSIMTRHSKPLILLQRIFPPNAYNIWPLSLPQRSSLGL